MEIDEDKIIAWMAAQTLIDESNIADVMVDLTVKFHGLAGDFRPEIKRWSLIDLICEIEEWQPEEAEPYEPDVYDIARDRALEDQ